MLAATTIVPKDEQSQALSGVALKLITETEPKRPCLVWPDGTKLELPESLMQILSVTAQALVRKQGVTVVVRSEWLTTKEAADMIGCSRQHVVELIEANNLKATKIGTHRRIKLSDLMNFINAQDQERDRAMADLVTHTEEFGGYDKPARSV
jgi:excisionase family DNA binding protein